MDRLTKMASKCVAQENLGGRKSLLLRCGDCVRVILSFLLVELYHMQDVIPILLTVYTTKALRWVETLT